MAANKHIYFLKNAIYTSAKNVCENCVIFQMLDIDILTAHQWKTQKIRDGQPRDLGDEGLH